MTKSYFIKKRIILILLAVVLCITPCFRAYASSSWRPDDDTIYSSEEGISHEAEVESVLSGIGSVVTTFVGGTLGLLLSPVFIAITDQLYAILAAAGISINSVIYGRVGGASDLTGSALFTFELSEGNIYGAIAMAIYNVLLAVFVIILICVILFRLTMLIYNGQDGQSRTALKSTLKSSVISIIAIFLMPKILDFALYIRDVVLYAIMTGGSSAIFNMSSGLVSVVSSAANLLHSFFGAGGIYSLPEIYRIAATGSLFNSIMYFASLILTLYFVFIYVSVALTFAILVIMFPFVCVIQAATGGNRMKDWCNEVLGLMMIPVIDAILLLFPLAFGVITSSLYTKPAALTLVEFALCASIIPARGFIRAKLGFGQASAMERSGIGAALGAIRLASSVVSAAKGITAGAKLKKKEADSLEDAAAMDTEMLEEHERQADATMDAMSEKSSALVEMNDEHFKGYDAANEKKNMAGLTGSKKISRAKASLDNYINETDRAIAQHQNDIENEQKKLSDYNKTISELSIDNKDGKHAEQIAQNKKDTAESQRKIQYANSRIAKLRELKRDAQTKSASLAAVGGDIDPGEREVLDSHANIENFDSYAFRNISPERRAELENARASVLRRSGDETLVKGLTLSGVGGFIGGAAATFMGPTAMMYGSSLGISLGSEIADFSVNVNYEKAVRDSSWAAASATGGTSRSSRPVINQSVLNQAVNQAVASAQADIANQSASTNRHYYNDNVSGKPIRMGDEQYGAMVIHCLHTNDLIACKSSLSGLYAARDAYKHEMSIGVRDSLHVKQNALKKAKDAYAESTGDSIINSGVLSRYEAGDVAELRKHLKMVLGNKFEQEILNPDNQARVENLFLTGQDMSEDGSFILNDAAKLIAPFRNSDGSYRPYGR